MPVIAATKSLVPIRLGEQKYLFYFSYSVHHLGIWSPREGINYFLKLPQICCFNFCVHSVFHQWDGITDRRCWAKITFYFLKMQLEGGSPWYIIVMPRALATEPTSSCFGTPPPPLYNTQRLHSPLQNVYYSLWNFWGFPRFLLPAVWVLNLTQAFQIPNWTDLWGHCS